MSGKKDILNEKKPFSLREWLFCLSFDRKIFLLGLFIAFCGLFFWIFYPYISELVNFEECAFKKATGFYCPGCGGIRSVRALLKGHILFSVIYNPFVPYCVFMWLIYTLSHILEILKVPHVKGMKYRDVYVYIAIFLLLSNWVIKNILLIVINL